jgi:hypothetical protein
MVVHRQPPRESLLPGEARDSDVLDDAEHWSAVYDELIAFLRRVRLDGSAIERFERRRDHWRSRRDQLTP